MASPDPTTGHLKPDMAPMELSTTQAFEVERMSTHIDSANDVTELRNMCKLLLQCWFTQKAATAWVMRQGLQR